MFMSASRSERNFSKPKISWNSKKRKKDNEEMEREEMEREEMDRGDGDHYVVVNRISQQQNCTSDE